MCFKDSLSIVFLSKILQVTKPSITGTSLYVLRLFAYMKIIKKKVKY